MLLMLTWLLSAAAPTARPLSPKVEANAQRPSFSPDGKKLAYELNFHADKRIQTWVMPVDGEPAQLQPRAGGSSGMTAGFETATRQEVVHELSWSPTALGSLVYSASGADRDYELYLSSTAPLGGSPIAASPGADGGAVWSPDGQWIAFSSARSGQGDVYLLSVEHLEQPPKRISRDEEASELYLAWGPNSDRLAWVGHTPKGDSIFIVEDMLRPTPRQLVKLGQTQTRPSFAPDGERVAFYSNHVDPERFDLYVMALSGQPKLLAEGVVLNHDGPTWTPDGQSLLFVRDDDARFDPVQVVSATGGQPRTLPTGTVGNGDLDLAPGAAGALQLAIAAQGRTGDSVRDFKRIYLLELTL